MSHLHYGCCTARSDAQKDTLALALAAAGDEPRTQVHANPPRKKCPELWVLQRAYECTPSLPLISPRAMCAASCNRANARTPAGRRLCATGAAPRDHVVTRAALGRDPSALTAVCTPRWLRPCLEACTLTLRQPGGWSNGARSQWPSVSGVAGCRRPAARSRRCSGRGRRIPRYALVPRPDSLRSLRRAPSLSAWAPSLSARRAFEASARARPDGSEQATRAACALDGWRFELRRTGSASRHEAARSG